MTEGRLFIWRDTEADSLQFVWRDTGLGQSKRESQRQKYLFGHSQGKSWKVKGNVRKSWTELK